jgi:peptidoglycan/xylan/chitin deacetylase (PgdA/CDA1 family)
VAALALTFDNLGEAAELEAGADPLGAPGAHPSVTEVLPELLDLLDELGLEATFFVEAINCEAYPDAVRAIAARGHEIGHHAWRHERWGELDRPRQVELLHRGMLAYAALGVPVAGFRPPGGGLGPGGAALLEAAGLAWASPEGERAAPGEVALLPFRWPLVDATYLYAPFAGLREGLGLPSAPLAPAAAMDALRAELAAEPDPFGAMLVLHPFLAVAPETRAAWFGFIRELAARRDAGELAIVPGGVAARALQQGPSAAR